MPRTVSLPRNVYAIRAWALAVLLLLLTPGAAQAHTRLKSSSPAGGEVVRVMPALLRLDFTESPELPLTMIELRGADGAVVMLGPVRYAPDSHRAVIAEITGALRAGSYRVTWQVVGDDGHPVRGNFEFTIPVAAMPADQSSPAASAASSTNARSAAHGGRAMPPTTAPFGVESPLYVLVRWVEFIALVLCVGAVAFRQVVLAGFARGGAATLATARDDAEHRAARIGVAASVLLLLDAGGRMGAQWLAVYSGAMPMGNGMMGMIEQSRWGGEWLLQVVSAVVIAIAFARARTRGGSALWTVLSVSALVLAFSPSLSGHAAASARLSLQATIADGAHVLGASAWVGGLALVMLAGLPAVHGLPERDRGAALARLVAAFSPVAMGGAALVTATGSFAAWLHMGSWSALWQTSYGQTLLVKLALVGLVALAGAYNWRVVTPRLTQTGGDAALRRAVRLELAFGALVLLATAVLVALPTPVDAPV